MSTRTTLVWKLPISPLPVLLSVLLLIGSLTAIAQPEPPVAPTSRDSIQDDRRNPIRRIIGVTPAQPVPSMAPLSSELIQHRSAGPDIVNMTPDGHPLGALPPPVDMSHVSPRRVREDRSPVGFPAAFDLRSQPSPKLTAVQDQGSAGSCWAFATYASLESCLLPGEWWDFSENNMKNTHGFDFAHGAGGQEFMSTAYLARWSGPVSEADDPYNDSSSYSPPNLPIHKHLQEVLWLASDPGEVKWAVYNYGAVYCTYYHTSTSFNSSTNAYYYGGTQATNHAVAIVGWDDNYSKLNFRTPRPSADGAWILKNSWGTGWGEDGYFYMSYEDSQLKRFVLFRNAEPVTHYARVHQYDPLGWVTSLGYQTHGIPFWAANVFTTAQAERLAAVGFYATDSVGTYELYIYRNVGATPTAGTLASSTSGSSTHAGYMTVPLPTPVDLNADEKFAVVLKLTTPNYGYPAAVEHAVAGYSSAATAQPGQSFYSSNGTSWADLQTLYPTANFCIKAFTDDLPAPTVTAIAPDTGTSGGTVNVTISGTGFRSGATAKLTRVGQPDISGAGLAVVSQSEVTCSFDLEGVEAGAWSVVVTNDDAQLGQLDDGFTVNGADSIRALAEGWHRMSIPAQTTESTPSAVLASLGETNVDWLLHDYLGGRYYRYPHPSVRDFAVGRGYWLRVLNAGTLQVAGTAVDSEQPFGIDLPTSWSILGCPFQVEVPWDDAHVQVEYAGSALPLSQAVAAGWLYPTIYAFEDGRNVPIHPDTSPGSLAPWQGYLINTRKAIRLVLTADAGQPMAASGVTPRRQASADDWRMSLIASAGGFSDEVVIGLRAATATTEATDRSAVVPSEPHPPLGPGVSIFIASRDERNDGSPGDALDLRSDIVREACWDFTVHSPDSHVPVTITWPDLSEVPHDLNIYLEDTATGKRLHMRTVGLYTFRPENSGAQRHFRVVVEQRQASAGMVTSLAAFGTADGGAELAFALSADASVDVTVMNIAGRVVRQVAANRMSSRGVNRLSWDGRSSSGTPVPNGRYLVRITARTEEGQVTNCITSLSVRR